MPALARRAARLVLLRPLLPLLVVVGGVQAASDGWNAGAVVTMRLLAMLLLADLVSMTTTMSELMEVLAPALRVLCPLGVNPRNMALAVALVLRFVPVLLTRWRAREEAWRARSRRRVPAAAGGRFRRRYSATCRPRCGSARCARLWSV